MARKTFKLDDYMIELINIFDGALDSHSATDIFNDKYNTNFCVRTLQQRYSTFKKGYDSALKEVSTDKELKRLAKAKNKVLRERKINTIQKNELNRNISQSAIHYEMLHQIKLGMDKWFPKLDIKLKTINSFDDVLEFVIGDFHYTGNHKDVEQIEIIKTVILEHVAGSESRIILSFLGDDIEGISAHKSQLLVVKKGGVQQAMEVAKLYSQLIKDIVKETGRKVDVLFVSRSNHGMIGGSGKERYQFPNEDVGIFISYALEQLKDKYLNVYKYGGVITHNGTTYLHGHQQYAKTKLKLLNELGLDNNIIMGHYHNFKQTAHKGRYIIVAPTCKSTYGKNRYDYEKEAGYHSTPQILYINRIGKDIKSVRPIDLERAKK